MILKLLNERVDVICYACGREATMQCASHDTYLCGQTECLAMHRWNEGPCDLAAPKPLGFWNLDPLDLLVHCFGILAILGALVMLYVHFGPV